ncbi:CRP-like cAMP-binding protein [Halopolyspora algeriensis]|uniref:CRP-like cAMP-binding protein n=1 Tax=Halopolyspora algeriensis TaxID=1500506 RepID=A0A368VKT0_9ACTN|nr:Crp/Fnr family transcriptional regulator [Halopolyspora algeriensis]RCW40253.1 CRP-like cAMP-binding protein [Halopolyspora algeriensis]TQM46266.1 CRP-like cAMP-binding protein [Halopolyspora algeriensis]
MSVDVEVAASLARSELSGLPHELLDRVLGRSVDFHVRAGGALVTTGRTDVFCYLLVSGLIRSYLISSAGRQVTLRYSRPGSLLGVATLFASGTAPAGLQAVTDARVLSLNPETLRALARSDVRVSHALLTELSDRAITYMNAIGDAVFSSLHDRVLSHLCDIATFGQRDSELSARISQQELADQVGTVREVVVRILRELRSAGLVRTERDRIVLLDSAREHAQGSGTDRRIGLDWNRSS